MGWRLIMALWLAVSLARTEAASSGERIAFDAAVRAFDNQLYRLAEDRFAEFIQAFPASPFGERAQAFELRSRGFRLAMQQDYAQAAEVFRRLRRDFPNSPNFLEFIVMEAWNEYRTGDRERVIQLLGEENSPFRMVAAIRPNDPLALPLLVDGRLLLAQTYMDTRRYEAAKRTLQETTGWFLKSEYLWRRRLLHTRLHLVENELTAALEQVETLVALAESTEVQEWIAESLAVMGEICVAVNRPEAAIEAYEKNLVEGVSTFRKREAWERFIALQLQQRSLPTVIDILKLKIARASDEVLSDIPLLALGKLSLKWYHQKMAAEPEETDRVLLLAELIEGARQVLERLIRDYPDSEFLDQAYYHLGWCQWELEAIGPSIAAFEKAVELLPSGTEKAISRFKLADGLYRQERYSQALAQYRGVAAEFERSDRVSERFLAQVLYQSVRAAVQVGDVQAAAQGVNELVRIDPESWLIDEGRLRLGQYLIEMHRTADARGLLSQVVEKFPKFPLRAEAEIAIARSYEVEGDWKSAERVYQQWQIDFPSHEASSQVAYDLARCTGLQGEEAEALARFETFLREYAESEQANWARLWIGNHHFNYARFEAAERVYSRILETKSEIRTSLICRVRLMAAKSAFRQREYARAQEYLGRFFRKVKDDPALEAELKAEVAISLGDASFEAGKLVAPEERTEWFCEAQAHFWSAVELAPDSPFGAMARGRFGDLSYYLGDYSVALTSYRRVQDDPHADISMRTQALVAMGMIYERQAELSSDEAEIAQYLKLALTSFYDVVFRGNLREGESFDPYWVREAGVRAAALEERQGNRPAGLRVYEELSRVIPVWRSDWDRLRQELQENSRD